MPRSLQDSRVARLLVRLTSVAKAQKLLNSSESSGMLCLLQSARRTSAWSSVLQMNIWLLVMLLAHSVAL